MRSRFITIPRGFTLIELLIVVAIIAILAAIAIPNFLEAQVRAKVARAKADMRTLATALEAYATDNNNYPWPILDGRAPVNALSTPVAFLTDASSARDPFTPKGHSSQPAYPLGLNYYSYRALNYDQGLWTGSSDGSFQAGDRVYWWYLASVGPSGSAAWIDGWTISLREYLDPESSQTMRALFYQDVMLGFYDPTNGSVSTGMIMRFGGAIDPNAAEFDKITK